MKKRILLIFIPIIVVIVIATVIVVLYFTTDLFRTDKELFWKYFAQNEDIMDILKNENLNIQNDFKKNNSYISNGNLKFLTQQGENSSKQLNVETTESHDANTNRTYGEAILKNGDIDLFTVSYINSNDIYAIQCSEIYQYYVGFQNSGLTELAEGYGLSNVPDTINFDELTQGFNLNDEQKNHIINTYLPIMQNNIEDTQFSSFKNESIEVNGQDYEANQYVLSLSGIDAKNILINILNGLKNDTEIQMILNNNLFIELENENNTNLTEKVDGLIDNIQNIEISNNIFINVYEKNGNTIYTSIDAGKYIISYSRLENVKKIDISIESEVENNTDLNNEIDTNEIIDLNNYAINSNTTTTFKIELNKTNSENVVTNEVKIIPDTNNSSNYLNVSIGMESIQDDSYNNSYVIEFGSSNRNSININTINYNTNTAKAEQIEEIPELTGSNTVVANNYPTDQFTAFLNTFLNSFIQVFENKLATIGFELT